MDPDSLLTAAQAARAVNVSRQLVRWWVAANRLSPSGYAPDGAPLYRLADVWTAERATRRSPLSSRNPNRLVTA